MGRAFAELERNYVGGESQASTRHIAEDAVRTPRIHCRLRGRSSTPQAGFRSEDRYSRQLAALQIAVP